MKLFLSKLTILMAVALCLSSCGGSTQNSLSTPPASFTIGGPISGLAGTGLVLQDNGTNNLTLSAGDTSFTFAAPIPGGTAYVVTVLTQPSNPVQNCSLSNASGTLTADVTNIQVACVGVNEWTWEGGSGGGASGALSWTDPSGTFWLFGGQYGNNSGYYVDLNTLSQYANGQWVNLSPSTLTPGPRYGAAGWTDASGNLWLYGGFYFDYADRGNNGPQDYLGDFWEYSAGQWTQPSASANYPGARYGAATWTDAAGHFWLFGGIGFSSGNESGGAADLNDLWEYKGGQWTLISAGNAVNQPGIYGTLGTASSSNVPGSRSAAVSWTDASGKFWLFGGVGYDSTGATGALNDLWKYSAGEWTWMNGSNLSNQAGTYGTQGTPAAGNVPGARSGAIGWIDASGNLWLFGGAGDGYNDFNDLWKYSAGEWTWVSGSNISNQLTVYGTQGQAAPGNIPGARSSAVSWIDTSGNLWLFGGADDNDFQYGPVLGDLWMYQP
jgi:hypothetical protein